MALQNEASICVSSAPKAVRNTARSRCSSAHHQRSSVLATSASASVIASRASEVRSARDAKLQPLVRAKIAWLAPHRLPDNLFIPSSIHEIPFRGVTGSAARPTAERNSSGQPSCKILTC
jgi:hypothetical protein